MDVPSYPIVGQLLQKSFMWDNIKCLREVKYGHVFLHLLVVVCHEVVHSNDELGLTLVQFPESVLES